MPDDSQTQYTQLVVRHQRLFGTGMLIGWFFINMLVLATTCLIEYQRAGKQLAVWEPFCWELSSAVMVLLLIPVGIFVSDKWLTKLPIKKRFAAHALATLLFSLVHVVGMVAIRQLWYSFMRMHYEFGEPLLGFLYEYRKDAQAYLTIGLVIFGYRFIVRRLQGEASYLAENGDGENKEEKILPERLLIKKLGREFLVQVDSIEWIEASGNYANLHVKTEVYPMRITMDKLEKYLPQNFIRVHRSTIVNITHIQEVQPLDVGDYQITLSCGKTLVLSRRYREAFKTLLNFEP